MFLVTVSEALNVIYIMSELQISERQLTVN